MRSKVQDAVSGFDTQQRHFMTQSRFDLIVQALDTFHDFGKESTPAFLQGTSEDLQAPRVLHRYTAQRKLKDDNDNDLQDEEDSDEDDYCDSDDDDGSNLASEALGERLVNTAPLNSAYYRNQDSAFTTVTNTTTTAIAPTPPVAIAAAAYHSTPIPPQRPVRAPGHIPMTATAAAKFSAPLPRVSSLAHAVASSSRSALITTDRTVQYPPVPYPRTPRMDAHRKKTPQTSKPLNPTNDTSVPSTWHPVVEGSKRDDSQRTSGTSQQVSSEARAPPGLDTSIAETKSWFDQDPSVYCSSRARHDDGGEVGCVKYNLTTALAPRPSHDLTSRSTVLPTRGLRARASRPSTEEDNFSWMTENSIPWPTKFMRPSRPGEVYSCVAEYEQAQLMNTLVALGRLDSHPGSTCRFPQELLDLLPRILCLAHDELLFAGSKLDLAIRRRTVREDLPYSRPTGIFIDHRAVFTCTNLGPGSLVINRQRGEILAMINFQHAGFLPSYVENVQGLFVETSHSSFWNVDRHVLNDDAGRGGNVDELQDGSVRRTGLLRTTRPSTLATPRYASPSQSTDAVAAGVLMVLGLRPGKDTCPSYSRRGNHPSPYPIINHYTTRGSSAPCKSMGYYEQPPPPLFPAPVSLPPSPEIIIKDSESISEMSSRTNNGTKHPRAFRGGLKNLAPIKWAMSRDRPGSPPASKSPIEAAMNLSLSSIPNSYTPTSAVTANQSESPSNVALSMHSDSVGRSNASDKHTSAGTNSSSSRLTVPKPFPTQVGMLVPRVPTVNQGGWSHFLDSYRAQDSQKSHAPGKDKQRATTSPVQSTSTSTSSSSCCSSPSSSFGSSGRMRIPVRPNTGIDHGPTKDASQFFEHGHESKYLDALICLCRTLQNLIVVLEAGGIVLTPHQLLTAVALKRQQWEQEQHQRQHLHHQHPVEIAVTSQQQPVSTMAHQRQQHRTESTAGAATAATVTAAVVGIPEQKSSTATPPPESPSKCRRSRRNIFITMLKKTTRRRPSSTATGSSAPSKSLPLLPDDDLPRTYRPSRSSDDNIFAMGQSTLSITRAPHDGNNISNNGDQNPDPERLRFPSINPMGLRLTYSRPGGRGPEEMIVPLATDLRLGSMTARHLPAYGIRLSNRDGTKFLAEVEMERIEGLEREFWKEFEGLCDRGDFIGDIGADSSSSSSSSSSSGSNDSSRRNNSNGRGNSSSSGSNKEAADEDDPVGEQTGQRGVDEGNKEKEKERRNDGSSNGTSGIRSRYPGVALLYLEDLVYHLEMVERYVTKLEAYAEKHYRNLRI
ncbi:hypothetical protein BGZ54_002652 [Gamsiella multidivaricata]|nr:hypothetical protein BGZ54_002652 [Gamsiella multidivaricata]